MPIDYKQYHPKWSLISRLIRFHRAKNKCEKCGLKNHQIIKRLKHGDYRLPFQLEWDVINNKVRLNQISLQSAIQLFGFTKVVLTVAHLDHDKENNRFNNLAALCQCCHLKHDLNQHIANRKYGRNYKGKHQLKIDL